MNFLFFFGDWNSMKICVWRNQSRLGGISMEWLNWIESDKTCCVPEKCLLSKGMPFSIFFLLLSSSSLLCSQIIIHLQCYSFLYAMPSAIVQHCYQMLEQTTAAVNEIRNIYFFFSVFFSFSWVIESVWKMYSQNVVSSSIFVDSKALIKNNTEHTHKTIAIVAAHKEWKGKKKNEVWERERAEEKKRGRKRMKERETEK